MKLKPGDWVFRKADGCKAKAIGPVKRVARNGSWADVGWKFYPAKRYKQKDLVLFDELKHN